jgi:cytochrome c peroxidase
MNPRITIIRLAAVSLFVISGLVALRSVSGLQRPAATRKSGLFQASIPKGLPAKLWWNSIPADNPMTAEKVALGEMLYFDKRLSANGTISCATCHDPAKAFADANAIAIGIGGKSGTRNAPTILNAMFNEAQFWDGRARTLEEQLKQPLLNPFEMGMPSVDAVVARVVADRDYRQRFRRVFRGQGITIDTIAKAIAAYERTRLSANSPFDRFLAGDADAITQTQKQGWDLFQHKAQCIACHAFSAASPFFTDFKFHNTGVAMKDRNFDELATSARRIDFSGPDSVSALGLLAHTEGFSELGRFLVTKQAKDIGAFKTPTLRDCELTTPYMHNGSQKTLLDVVKFYNRGGEHNPNLDEQMRPPHLTDLEMSCLVEFLRALTSNDVLRQTQLTTPQTRASVLR